MKLYKGRKVYIRTSEVIIEEIKIEQDGTILARVGNSWYNQKEIGITKPKKSKDMCLGCRDNIYNGAYAKECWRYKKAKIIELYAQGKIDFEDIFASSDC